MPFVQDGSLQNLVVCLALRLWCPVRQLVSRRVPTNPKKKRKVFMPSVPDAVVDPIKVVHLNSGKVHIWHTGVRTLCSKWKCGSLAAPSSNAIFASPQDSTASPDSMNCKDCFGERLKFLRVAISADDDAASDTDEFEA